jgi:hypothetical protein
MTRALIAALVVVVYLAPASVAGAAARPSIAVNAPSSAEAEQVVPIAVRTSVRVTVTLHAAWPGGTSTQKARTDDHGRTTLFYDTPFSAQPYVAWIKITARVGGHTRAGQTSIAVHPFKPTVAVHGIQIRRADGDSWTATSTITAQDRVRIMAQFAILELAGWYAAPCAAGIVTLTSGQTVLASLPVQCGTSEPASGGPLVYADWTVPSTITTGTLGVTVDLAYDEGRYGIARGEGTASVNVTDSGT